MQKWQEDRNYRKYKNTDGTFTHIITVDGENVEVSAEVYEAYSQEDRRERYQAERDKGVVLSLDKISEDEMQLSYFTKRHNESAEDTAVRSIMLRHIHMAIPRLDAGEQELIGRLYTDADTISIREYARQKGLSDFAIRHRERRVMEKIQKLLGI